MADSSNGMEKSILGSRHRGTPRLYISIPLIVYGGVRW
jgi:hypothetical protein